MTNKQKALLTIGREILKSKNYWAKRKLLDSFVAVAEEFYNKSYIRCTGKCTDPLSCSGCKGVFATAKKLKDS